MRLKRRGMLAALCGGILLVLAGCVLLVGSLAHFDQGNILAGLLIVAMAGYWIYFGGAALTWRQRRLRSPRRSGRVSANGAGGGGGTSTTTARRGEKK